MQNADAGDLGRLLRHGSERRGGRTGQRGQQEAAAIHTGMVGPLARQSSATHSLHGRLKRQFASGS
jgi:hypothetical protein